MKASNFIARLLLSKTNRELARNERNAAVRQQIKAQIKEYGRQAQRFEAWAKAHPNHPLVERVMAECEELNQNLKLDDMTRAKRFGVVVANANRLALEEDAKPPPLPPAEASGLGPSAKAPNRLRKRWLWIIIGLGILLIWLLASAPKTAHACDKGVEVTSPWGSELQTPPG